MFSSFDLSGVVVYKLNILHLVLKFWPGFCAPNFCTKCLINSSRVLVYYSELSYKCSAVRLFRYEDDELDEVILARQDKSKFG